MLGTRDGRIDRAWTGPPGSPQRTCAAIVIPVGKLLQFAVTAGLVHATVLPPAGPATANVPVHGVPLLVVAFHVNVPEKLDGVVVPVTVPLPCAVVQVPVTFAAD